MKGVEFFIPTGGGGIPGQMKTGQVTKHIKEWCQHYNVMPMDTIRAKGKVTYYFSNTDIPKFVLTFNTLDYTITD
jgi:hypothetical protein|tara:strand:+ start:694 stop:918 length:225 start_codon:yes stop_codon:yes gene_type:complete